ncbi:M16 family metallopeptidase [Patescibacteria group bacterium]
MSKLTTHVFQNGMPAAFVALPDSRVNTAILIVGAGTRFETLETQGLARFYANICFQGSKDYASKDQLWNAIDALGLTIKPAVYPEYCLYYFSSSPQVFNDSLSLFMNIFFQPALTQAGLEAEKQLTKSEIELTSKNPQLISLNTLTSLIFNQSSLGFDAMGSDQGLTNIDLSALQDFKSKYYGSQNCLLLVLGPDKNFALESLEGIIKTVPQGPRLDPPPFDLTQTKIVQEKINQPGSYSNITLGSLCFGRNSDKRIIQNILLNILSEGRKNQRLKTLQENKLVSFIKPWIKTFSDCGLLLIQAACQTTNEQQVLLELKSQLSNLQQSSITQEELDKAKLYYTNKLLNGLSNSLELGLFYSLSYFFSLNEQTPEEIINIVKNCTLEEINDLAKTIFKPEALSWVTVGPGY